MIKDYSKIPSKVTITNSSDKDVNIALEFVNEVVPANGSIILTAHSSEYLALVIAKVNDIENLSVEFEEADEAVKVTSTAELATAVKDPEITSLKLAEDLEITSKLNVKGKSLTIDGNGKTVSLSGSKGYFATAAGGELTLRNMTINMADDAVYGVQSTYGSKLTIEKDVIINTNGRNYPVVIFDEGTTLDFYGTVNGSTYGCIYGNQKYGGTVINIHEGAKLISECEPAEDVGPALSIPQDGTVNIEGATIIGPSAIGIKAGTLNITNSVIKATGPKMDVPASKTGVMNAWGDGIVVEVHKSYEGGKVDDNIKINISEDTTIESENADPIRCLNLTGKSIVVTGPYVEQATEEENVTVYNKVSE